MPKNVLLRRSNMHVPAATRPLAYIAVLLLALTVAVDATAAPAPDSSTTAASWSFAVSGDSRNCGDIVMPAIAQQVLKDGAAFYWHLGDFRAIYSVDEDYLQLNPATDVSHYQSNAWPDFIEHQLKPFGMLPVFLAIGNHEVIPPMSREKSVLQFADWLDTPLLQQQRLADDANDHQLKTYYHWIDRGIDFVTLDNASADELDAVQQTWFTGVLNRAALNKDIKTVVVASHAALPDSLSAGHSMNDSAQGRLTGRRVYAALVDFRQATGKHVYALASHSHYVMSNVFATSCRREAEILDGWVVGSAGAVRNRLPADHAAANVAFTDVYGYLLGTVSADGSIRFEFKEVKEPDVPHRVVQEYSVEKVHWCFAENKSPFVAAGVACSAGAVPTPAP